MLHQISVETPLIIQIKDYLPNHQCLLTVLMISYEFSYLFNRYHNEQTFHSFLKQVIQSNYNPLTKAIASYACAYSQTSFIINVHKFLASYYQILSMEFYINHPISISILNQSILIIKLFSFMDFDCKIYSILLFGFYRFISYYFTLTIFKIKYCSICSIKHQRLTTFNLCYYF